MGAGVCSGSGVEDGFGVGVGVLFVSVVELPKKDSICCHIDLNRLTARLGAVNMLLSKAVLVRYSARLLETESRGVLSKKVFDRCNARVLEVEVEKGFSKTVLVL